MINESKTLEDRLDRTFKVGISGAVIGTAIAGPLTGMAAGIASSVVFVFSEGAYEDWSGTLLKCPECKHEYKAKGLDQWVDDWDAEE